MRNRRKRPYMKTQKLSDMIANNKTGTHSSSHLTTQTGDKCNLEQNSNNETMKEGELNSKLNITCDQVKKRLGNPHDLIIREFEFEVHSNQKITAAIIFLEELNDPLLVNEFILEPLMALDPVRGSKTISLENTLHYIKQNGISLGKVSDVETEEELIESLLEGLSVLLIEGCKKGLKLGTYGGKARGIEEPTTEVVIRGPKQGFTENLKTNLSMVRRIVKSPDLRIEKLVVGDVTKTDIAIVYLDNIANPLLIKEVKERINQIKTDAIIESGQLEEFIQDETVTVFPQMVDTERPDVVAGNILEGRVGILVNGTPFSLIAPTQFIQFFQSSEDYYMRYDISSFLRLLRFSVFIISLIAPSIYIALTTFHQAMIPTTLAFRDRSSAGRYSLSSNR